MGMKRDRVAGGFSPQHGLGEGVPTDRLAGILASTPAVPDMGVTTSW
jgi:hypothetical protein